MLSIFLASKITADGYCSHKIKKCLLLGRQVMTNLGSILKSLRHYFVNKGPSSQGYGFSSGHVWMWELDYKEKCALKNWCLWTVVLEKTLESPLDCKEIQPVHPGWSVLGVHWKDWCWSWNSNALAIWWEELTLLKRPWCWESLRAGGEGDDREWDGWKASLTQWTWVWVKSGSWWWTGRPGVLRFMGSQRVGHYWATELNWTLLFSVSCVLCCFSLHWTMMLRGSSFLHVQSSHLSDSDFPLYPLAPSFIFLQPSVRCFHIHSLLELTYEDHCDFVLFLIYSSSFKSMSIFSSTF